MKVILIFDQGLAGAGGKTNPNVGLTATKGGIGFASSGGKTYAVQFGAGFPEALQGRTSQVPSVVVPQMIPFPCLLSSRAYLFSHITTPWMILLELY